MTKGDIGPVDCNGTIGDYVWHDVDRNGLQGPTPDEHGINGQTMTLTGTDSTGKSDYFLQTTTAGNGFYQFTGLCTGDYKVSMLIPGTYQPTTPDVGGDRTIDSNGINDNAGGVISTVSLTDAKRNDPTIDFGFQTVCDAKIGNFVWHDINRNGLQDDDEPGIGGVTVKLLDGSGNELTPPLQNETTGDGLYRFDGLCSGTYTVDVIEGTRTPLENYSPTTPFAGTAPGQEPTAPSDSNGGSNGEGFVITVNQGTNNQTIDFGYLNECAGVIGDLVWYDRNQHGLQDDINGTNGEPGIGGVIVKAFLPGPDAIFGNGDDVEAGQGTTDAFGYYFIKGLCRGTYQVIVSNPPAGYIGETQKFAPTGVEAQNPETDDNGSGYIVTLSSDIPGDPASQNLTIDFGYIGSCNGTIGDLVWLDANADGIQGAHESGLAGAQVIVRRLSDQVAMCTITTDSEGDYLCNNLCPGSYRVEITPPADYFPSPTQVGSDRTIDSNPAPWTTTLVYDNSEDLTIDFGYYPPAKLGDFVWEDKNANGQQVNGEPGIDGVKVSLLDCSGNPVLVNGNPVTTTTANGGWYLFDNLMPGCYRVKFDTPAGYTPTQANQGNDASDSDAVSGITGNYTLGPGGSDLTADAGFYKPASLGDRVWEDKNNNGLQDANESGLSGVSVTLYTCGGTFVAGPISTDASGLYKFTGLMPGSYYVVFGTKDGYTRSTQYAQGQDPNAINNNDSNADANGRTGCVTLASGEYNPTIDAGLVPASQCVPGKFTFSGNTALYGTPGNIRTFSVNGVSVNASAFSRDKSVANWKTAYLGAYAYGLGVTDRYEGDGSNDRHRVDNIDRNNYILFEFSSPVVLSRAYLDAVLGDSDVSVWYGTFTNPFTNHLTLSDALLSSMANEQNATTSSSARWAAFNGGQVEANVLIVAADVTDTTPDDWFKVHYLEYTLRVHRVAGLARRPRVGGHRRQRYPGRRRAWRQRGQRHPAGVRLDDEPADQDDRRQRQLQLHQPHARQLLRRLRDEDRVYRLHAEGRGHQRDGGQRRGPDHGRDGVRDARLRPELPGFLDAGLVPAAVCNTGLFEFIVVAPGEGHQRQRADTDRQRREG